MLLKAIRIHELSNFFKGKCLLTYHCLLNAGMNYEYVNLSLQDLFVM